MWKLNCLVQLACLLALNAAQSETETPLKTKLRGSTEVNAFETAEPRSLSIVDNLVNSWVNTGVASDASNVSNISSAGASSVSGVGSGVGAPQFQQLGNANAHQVYPYSSPKVVANTSHSVGGGGSGGASVYSLPLVNDNYDRQHAETQYLLGNNSKGSVAGITGVAKGSAEISYYLQQRQHQQHQQYLQHHQHQQQLYHKHQQQLYHKQKQAQKKLIAKSQAASKALKCEIEKLEAQDLTDEEKMALKAEKKLALNRYIYNLVIMYLLSLRYPMYEYLFAGPGIDSESTCKESGTDMAKEYILKHGGAQAQYYLMLLSFFSMKQDSEDATVDPATKQCCFTEIVENLPTWLMGDAADTTDLGELRAKMDASVSALGADGQEVPEGVRESVDTVLQFVVKGSEVRRESLLNQLDGVLTNFD